MYVGIKNIQTLFNDFPTFLTSSDGIHCLTGWHKFSDAPQPYASYLLYICEAHELPILHDLKSELHVLCITGKLPDPETAAETYSPELSLLFVE